MRNSVKNKAYLANEEWLDLLGLGPIEVEKVKPAFPLIRIQQCKIQILARQLSKFVKGSHTEVMKGEQKRINNEIKICIFTSQPKLLAL